MFKSVIDFFKESTKKHPNKLALVFKNQKITYAELDNKSDIVMWYLLSKGVQKGQYVGILLERSIYTIVVMLGVMKAGAAYINIDPLYPKERIKYIINNSKLSILITDVYDIFNNTAQKRIQLKKNLLEKDTAFVVYTSGSTGTPKGVVSTHGNISYYVQNLSKRIGIVETDVYLHTASMAFSSSNRQIF